MAQDAAKAFLDRLAQDETLREKAAQPGGDMSALGAAEGFGFTEEEMRQALAESQAGTDELSDEQLGKVSGGTSNLTAKKSNSMNNTAGSLRG